MGERLFVVMWVKVVSSRKGEKVRNKVIVDLKYAITLGVRIPPLLQN
jgi:hypothetical protein